MSTVARSLAVALALPLLLSGMSASAETPAPAQPSSQLAFVIYLSRHGVRSPTGKATQYAQYSSAAWPAWPVQPGYLTPHGYQLMQLFGAYDREQLSSEGLLPPTGCAAASQVTFYADSDQRTRETGRALAAGLMPGCKLTVHGLPEGTNDPLFHPTAQAATELPQGLARAAIAGRIGDDPSELTAAYRAPLAELDHLLATCGVATSSAASERVSLLSIPASLTDGHGDHLAELRGPLNTAATLAENLLLEYTEGMPKSSVGWGCVHRAEIVQFIALHTAATDFTQRTPVIARAQVSNLLLHLSASLQQAAQRTPVAGALSQPTDRALFLIGHDTNLENLSGLLNLTWIADGRRDDTPPGSALVFELWRDTASGDYSVRTFYTAQTLDQMRAATPLSLATPPARVPVFIPGCGRADLSCSLADFLQLTHAVTDARSYIP